MKFQRNFTQGVKTSVFPAPAKVFRLFWSFCELSLSTPVCCQLPPRFSACFEVSVNFRSTHQCVANSCQGFPSVLKFLRTFIQHHCVATSCLGFPHVLAIFSRSRSYFIKKFSNKYKYSISFCSKIFANILLNHPYFVILGFILPNLNFSGAFNYKTRIKRPIKMSHFWC